MAVILNLQDVGMAYHTPHGEIPALSHISFQIQEGEFVSIVGPSGCGKSSLLNIIAGLFKPETGAVTLGISQQEKTPVSIGYMLQKDHLFQWRTIYENVILGLEIQKKITPERLVRVHQLLKDYGLEDFKDARPSQLSGGMRQRTALIRTLALEPSLLLLDEPFSALDYQTRLKVSNDIGKIIRKEKKTALLVTHDIAEAVSMSDRVIVLSDAPATVRCEIPILLNPPSHTPMEARNAENFKEYFNKIWKELNPDE